jgi:hypothetical protein
VSNASALYDAATGIGLVLNPCTSCERATENDAACNRACHALIDTSRLNCRGWPRRRWFGRWFRDAFVDRLTVRSTRVLTRCTKLPGGFLSRTKSQCQQTKDYKFFTQIELIIWVIKLACRRLLLPATDMIIAQAKAKWASSMLHRVRTRRSPYAGSSFSGAGVHQAGRWGCRPPVLSFPCIIALILKCFLELYLRSIISFPVRCPGKASIPSVVLR